jgi:hypothetical protein
MATGATVGLLFGRIHPRSQRNIEAWLDRLRTRGFWLVEDHVLGRYDRVRSEPMGARREGIDA